MDTFNPGPEGWQPPDPQPEGSFGGIRRGIGILVLSATLLVVGGAAVTFAASPDPSASPTPAGTTNPSGGATTPNGGATTPKSTHDCPNMGGGGTNRGTNRGTNPTPVSPTTPTTPSSTPSV